MDHARAGLVRAEGQAQHPLGAVVPVVVHFLDGLRGDGGEGGVGGVGKPAVQLELVVAHDELPGDGDREVAVGLLEQLHRAEFVLAAEVGEVVLAPAVQASGVAQEGPGVAQLVQRDVAQGDVLFELGCPGNPVAQALGQDQGIVAQAEGQFGDVLARFRGAAADGQGNVLGPEGVARRDARGAGGALAAAAGSWTPTEMSPWPPSWVLVSVGASEVLTGASRPRSWCNTSRAGSPCPAATQRRRPWNPGRTRRWRPPE